MSPELVVTGLVMGLAGAAHCTAMCGAACLALTRPDRREAGEGEGVLVAAAATSPVTWLRVSPAAPGAPGGMPRSATSGRAAVALAEAPSALAAFLAARLASYALGGAAVAAAVSVLAALGQQVAMLRPVWTMFHVGLLVLGLWLLATGRQPRWLASLGVRRQATDGRATARPAAVRAALAGAAWVAVPCGLLQSALVTAALADGPLGGAAVMAAFAATSSVGLVAAPALRGLFARFGPSGDRWVTRLAGAMLAGASVWALAMLATAGAAAALCVV